MSKEGKSKKPEGESDITTNLLRQMGLAEDEIKSALELADKIEKKVGSQKELEVEPTPAPKAVPVSAPSKYDLASKKDLLNIIETQNAKLNHFQNVVAVQFVLLIKKYKDKLISLENKLLEKNTEIASLEKRLREKQAEVQKLNTRLEFLLK
ncbi:MAG: hypothetical protein LUQ65_12440 [Candidatus Helarchaeota archaeon]|nr:hypothetical protein [Candidatus Helarchaeota archaeon]